MSLHRTRRDALGETGPPESLEVEANLRRDGARRYVVRAAKRRQEVVQRVVVRQVNDVQLCAPLVFVRLEQVVISDCQVEEASRRDALRIMVVVFSAGRGHRDQRRSKLRSQTRERQRRGWGCVHTVAGKSALELLICSQGCSRDGVNQIDGRQPIDGSRGPRASCGKRVVAGSGTRHESAVVTPVEAEPRSALPRRLIPARERWS